MANTREIRKRNIINWSIHELEQLALAMVRSRVVPYVMTETIAELKEFNNKANWADFQNDPESTEWKSSLNSINIIRTRLLTLIRQEKNNKYENDVYDIAEAILLGFTEQWPLNNFEECNQENASARYAPQDCISLQPLTTLKEEGYFEGSLLHFAILPLDGFQMSKESLESIPAL